MPGVRTALSPGQESRSGRALSPMPRADSRSPWGTERANQGIHRSRHRGCDNPDRDGICCVELRPDSLSCNSKCPSLLDRRAACVSWNDSGPDCRPGRPGVAVRPAPGVALEEQGYTLDFARKCAGRPGTLERIGPVTIWSSDSADSVSLLNDEMGAARGLFDEFVCEPFDHDRPLRIFCFDKRSAFVAFHRRTIPNLWNLVIGADLGPSVGTRHRSVGSLVGSPSGGGGPSGFA